MSEIIDPNVDFGAHVAQQLAKKGEAASTENTPAASAPGAPAPSDPALDSAAAIRASVLSPELSTSTVDGLTLPSEPPAPRPTITPDVREAMRQAQLEEQQLAADRDELATRRALDAIGPLDVFDVDDLSEDQLIAIAELRQGSPSAFAEFRSVLDEQAVAEFELMGEDITDDVQLPSDMLDEILSEYDNHLSFFEADAKVQGLQARIEGEIAAVLDARYGHLPTAEARIAHWEADRQALEAIGADISDPRQLEAGLKIVDASVEEADAQARLARFKQSLWDAPGSRSVSDGLERVNDAGELVPLTPRPKFGIQDDAEFGASVIARAQAKDRQASVKQLTPEQRQAALQRAMLADDPSSTRGKTAWTTKDGKPLDLHAEMAKRERAKQEQEKRERASEIGL